MNRRAQYAAWLLLATGCREQQPAREAEFRAAAPECGVEVRRVVEAFGARLKLVPVLAPDSVAVRSIRQAYGPFVAPELLARWQADPSRAPGREVSNPWPARIEIRSIMPEARECLVEGDIIYVTTADPATVVEQRHIRLQLRDGDSWRVSSYEVVAAAPAHAAATVVRRYYQAIAAGDFDAAYAMWADSGRASGQSAAEFADGFAETVEVRAVVDDSVRMEGVAGSQYATVNVHLSAALRDGLRQRFAGTYTLRRSTVDGASPEQRSWRIHSADMRPR